jgi:diketogulonate reductase-like aldo/keto reductase
MLKRTFGPLIDVQVPVIGQGTWNLETDPDAARAAIQAGLDAGLTHIDTAEMYGRGKVEEIVGEAIAGRRDEVFLVTKVLPENATRTGTLEACERSLRRLKTDRLDCYLLHWESSHPLEETISAFAQLQEDGKILSWGVSNFDVQWLEKALSIAGEGRMACNQVLYHLRERAIEHEVIPWCEENGVAVVAYSPFGQGNFPGPRSPEGSVLTEVARAHNATPHQVALAFLTRRPSVFAIPMTSKTAHARENAAAAGVELTDEQIARLDQAFPLGAPRPGVPTL